MQNILDTVTKVIVAKLMDYQHFKDTLVKHAMQAGVLDRIKQELMNPGISNMNKLSTKLTPFRNKCLNWRTTKVHCVTQSTPRRK